MYTACILCELHVCKFSRSDEVDACPYTNAWETSLREKNFVGPKFQEAMNIEVLVLKLLPYPNSNTID